MKNNALLKYYQMMGSKPPKPTGYIQFEDPEVERICIANFSSDGVGVTYEDAEKVTSLHNIFIENDIIKSFIEFQYFKNALLDMNSRGDGQFFHCSKLKKITLPEKITYIPPFSFTGCANLSDVNLNNVTIAGIRTFEETALTDINMPNLQVLGGGVFNRSKVERVMNLGSVKSLPMGGNLGMFEGSNLKYASLPNTLESIGAYCFPSSIETIILKSLNPPTLSSSKPFSNNPYKLSIYVPDESVEAYKAAPNWSTYADKIKPLSTYVEPTNN